MLHKDERRVERKRRERVCRQPLQLAGRRLGGDHRYASGKAAKRVAQLTRIQRLFDQRTALHGMQFPVLFEAFDGLDLFLADGRNGSAA